MADLELLGQTTSRRRKKGFKAEPGSVQTIVNCTQRAGRKEGCWTGFTALERAPLAFRSPYRDFLKTGMLLPPRMIQSLPSQTHKDGS